MTALAGGGRRGGHGRRWCQRDGVFDGRPGTSFEKNQSHGVLEVWILSGKCVWKSIADPTSRPHTRDIREIVENGGFEDVHLRVSKLSERYVVNLSI